MCPAGAKALTRSKHRRLLMRISVRSMHSWISKYPAFAAAVYRARAKAKMKLVRVHHECERSDDWRRGCVDFRTHRWPNEYSRVSAERIEQIGEPADDKKVSLQIGDYNNNEQPAFGTARCFLIQTKVWARGHDSAKVARQKQEALSRRFRRNGRSARRNLRRA